MMMLNIKKQSGFTLVEIAIVLVIIGLLLGGILKGQELVTSARVRNLADQNSGVQAAYFGFIDRYRNLPGDMNATQANNAIGDPILAGNNIGGNGNGQIDDGSFPEATAVWAHLQTSGFITGGYPGDPGGGVATAAAYAGVNAAGLNYAPTNAFLGPVLLANLDEYIQVAAGVPAVRLAYVFGNQIPVNVMRELDVKIDDGIPDTGVMRASATAAVGAANFNGVETEGGIGAAGVACTAAGAGGGGGLIWNIAGNGQNCNGVFIY